MWRFARQRSPQTDDDLDAHRPKKPAEERDKAGRMLQLQRAAGNQAVQKMVAAMSAELQEVVALEDFEGNKADLTERDCKKLDALAESLKRAAGCGRVSITGHAGPGDTEDAVKLGERRAEMVRAYLEMMGVPGELLRTRGGTAARRQAAGRQVEIVVYRDSRKAGKPA